MAPDINSLAPQPQRNTSSPQNPNASISRSTPSTMPPPAVPQHSSIPSSPRPQIPMLADSTTSGPIRHPRPLTAAELHLELEKEQESIVNRLTRELSALRAQTASVASSASSTSHSHSHVFPDSLSPPQDYTTQYSSSGTSIIPTAARRHRSSSNLSQVSSRSARDQLARDAQSTSVSGVAAPRERERDRERGGGGDTSHLSSARQSLEISRDRPETSRQSSYNLNVSTGTTGGGVGATPHRTSSAQQSPFDRYTHAHRSSMGNTRAEWSQSTGEANGLLTGMPRSPGSASAQPAHRYEEATVQRAELEAVKRENEILKERIRDLEREIAARAGSAGPGGGGNGAVL